MKVLNLACEECAKTIAESLHTMVPDAKIDIDVKDKTVTVESRASEESIKQVIISAGYSIEGYS